MKRNLLLMFAFLLASIGIASAQQTITVTGTVVAESDGQPVAGAYVLVNGTTIGTITDAEGRFGIKAVPADAKEIIVTFLGMSTASAKVSTEPLHIVMKADATYLEDVVVVEKRRIECVLYSQFHTTVALAVAGRHDSHAAVLEHGLNVVEVEEIGRAHV